VKFSICHFPRSWDEEDDGRIIDAVVEHSLEADSLGFDGIFFPEHHFHGYSPTGSDPFMTAAYLASQLRKAWLGFAVVVAPLHHPVRLVEMMNQLDQLTKGKVLFGIGSGIHAEEAVGYGNNFDYQVGSMTQEFLDIADRLWAKRIDDPPVHFETPNFKGDVLERIVPAPYTKPHPKLIGVAGRDSSIQRAAANGWPVYVGAFDQGWRNLRAYREALAAAGHDAKVLTHCMDWTTVTFQGMFVAETDEEALQDLIETMTGHEEHIQRQTPFIRAAEALGNVSQEKVRLRPPANTEAYYSRFCLWGSPDTIAAKMQAYADAGIGNVLMSFNNGLHSEVRVKSARKSLNLFAQEVMPRFQALQAPHDPLAIDLGEGVAPMGLQERLAYH
jgi:alkanesulfonate monooxygenase SsuD/methylene tetrahydromethanopterin reductase-like flavin-dependent oxidoreductase (luciferase family)